jgi:uncharacterized membrane protein
MIVVRRYLDLLIVTLVAVAGIVVFLRAIDIFWLRLPVSLALIFFLPGYALTAALFPNRQELDDETLGTGARFMLSLGLSLAIVGLTGLALNRVSSLQTASWAVSLAAITIVAAAASAWRRLSYADSHGVVAAGHLPLRGLLLLILAAAVAGSAVVTSRVAAERQSQPGFTSLWMIPAKGPHQSVHVGLANHEGHTMYYTLIVRAHHRTVWRLTHFVVPNDKTWQTAMMLPESPGTRLEAWLYRAGHLDIVYRKVSLWSQTP